MRGTNERREHQDGNLVVRRADRYADQLGQYRVIVDGREIGRVANGESTSFQVDPGKHTIQLRIQWCASPPLEFESTPGATVVVECSAPDADLFVLWRTLFRRKRYISVSLATDSVD
jgi:hypothetical protein